MSQKWKDAVTRLRRDMEKDLSNAGCCCSRTSALLEPITLSDEQRNTISRSFPHLRRIDSLAKRSPTFLDISVETLGRVSAVLRIYRQGAAAKHGDYDPSEGPSHNEIEAMHLLKGCGFAPALLEEGELLVPIRMGEQLYRFWYIRHQVRGRRFCELVRGEREMALEQLRKFAVMCSMVNLEVGGVDAKSVLWDGEKIVWTDFSGFQSTARPVFAVEEDNMDRIEELISKLQTDVSA